MSDLGLGEGNFTVSDLPVTCLSTRVSASTIWSSPINSNEFYFQHLELKDKELAITTNKKTLPG